MLGQLDRERSDPPCSSMDQNLLVRLQLERFDKRLIGTYPGERQGCSRFKVDSVRLAAQGFDPNRGKFSKRTNAAQGSGLSINLLSNLKAVHSFTQCDHHTGYVTPKSSRKCKLGHR